MESKSSRHVEIAIDVMDIVKPPEKRNFMVRSVTIIKAQVHQKKSHDKRERGRQCKERQQTELDVRRAIQQPGACRSHRYRCHPKRQGGNAEIDKQTPKQRRSAGTE